MHLIYSRLLYLWNNTPILLFMRCLFQVSRDIAEKHFDFFIFNPGSIYGKLRKKLLIGI